MKCQLSKLCKDEINEILAQCNFTEDEETVFAMVTKGKSLVEISMSMNMSLATVGRRIDSIKKKIDKGVKYKKVPIESKLNLTVEEAAEYSNLGTKTIYKLLSEENCNFVLTVGKKKLVKRKRFEEFLASVDTL